LALYLHTGRARQDSKCRFDVLEVDGLEGGAVDPTSIPFSNWLVETKAP
jgi:hypothetical protein